MSPKIPNATFSQIVKNPLTWGFVALFSLMITLVTTFVTVNFNQNTKNENDCKEEKAILRKENDILKSENKTLQKEKENLFIAFTVKEGMNEKFLRVIDSLNNKQHENK